MIEHQGNYERRKMFGVFVRGRERGRKHVCTHAWESGQA